MSDIFPKAPPTEDAPVTVVLFRLTVIFAYVPLLVELSPLYPSNLPQKPPTSLPRLNTILTLLTLYSILVTYSVVLLKPIPP